MLSLKLKERQEETYDDLVRLLDIYGKCAIVRPTGFGKTYTLARYIGNKLKQKNNKNILYVYPSEIVKQTVIGYISDDGLIAKKYRKQISFMSYYKFGLLCKHKSKELIGNIRNKFDTIIFDEMQYMGAINVQNGLEELIPQLSKYKINYIGASATPIRTDGINVVEKFFDNIYTDTYTLGDMVADGIIAKPWYIYSSYIAKEHFEKNQLYKKLSNEKAIKVANKLGELYNCDAVIKRNILNMAKEYKMDLSYMKFICFFLEKKQIKEKASLVIRYFKQAFPNYKIRTLIIHSDKEYIDNIDNLSKFNKTRGVIDVIFSINMLNLGYHVDDITGVMMFRNTKSTIIYPQQIGRAISVNSKYPAIIFDFVGNFNISPIIKDCDDIIENDTVRISKERKTDELENSFVLIDEIKSFEDYLARMEISVESLIDKSIKMYIARDESGIIGSKYGMTLEQVQKVAGSAGIIHNIIKELKRRGYRLLEWDMEKWGEYYEQC